MSTEHIGHDAGHDRVSRLVGRDNELAQLSAHLDGRSAFAVLEGEPGIGKTRLIQALLMAEPTHRQVVLEGGCDALAEPYPFGPVVQALSTAGSRLPSAVTLPAITGALGSIVPELAAHLPDAPPPLQDLRAERHRAVRAIAALLAALGPTLLVLEDVHWADEGTRELLVHLLAHGPPDLAVLVSLRTGAQLGSHVWEALQRSRTADLHVILEPLDLESTQHMAECILGQPVDAHAAAALHEHSAGVPYAVEELLAVPGTIAELDASGRASPRIAPSLRHAVMDRLARVDEDVRSLVEALAVVGPAADDRVLAAVWRRPAGDVVDGLARAVSARVLYDRGDGLRFQHGLVEQAVYESIPTPARRRMHHLALEALHGSETSQAAILAHHAWEAGAIDAYLTHVEAAADHRTARGDDAGAARLLATALERTSPTVDDALRLATKLGHAARHALLKDLAVPVIRSVLDRANRAPGTGALRLLLGRLLRHDGDTELAHQEIERALGDLGDDADQRARALAVLAYPARPGVTMDAHLDRMHQALELTRAPELADSTTARSVAIDHLNLLLNLGDEDAHQQVATGQAVASLEDSPEDLARACVNWSQGVMSTGHLGLARDLVMRARADAAAFHHGYVTGPVDAVEVMLDWLRGEWEGLEARARRVVNDTHMTTTDIEMEWVLAALDSVRGDAQAARRHLGPLLRRASRAGLIQLQCQAAGRLAQLALDGDAKGVPRGVVEAVEVLRRKRIWVWSGGCVSGLVELLAADDQLAAAKALTDELADGIDHAPARWGQAELAVCRAAVVARSDASTALEELDTALTRYESLPAPFEVARVHARRGMVSAAAGSPEEALSAFTEALTAYDTVGATNDVERLKRTMRRHGLAVPHPWRGGRRSYGGALSPRERDVADLAADGHTNRQIADRLFISKRTVDGHMTRILQKTGVRARADLPAWLERADEAAPWRTVA